MPALSTAQEYQAIREALQLFSQGQTRVSVTVGDMSVAFASSQMDFLQKREQELARRLSIRNVRKRTRPDFT
jgi:L-2-hydroxyglutarate oxidase LhgO